MPGTYHLQQRPQKMWHLDAVCLEMKDRLAGGPKVMAEIGVYLGWFSEGMLERFPNLSTILVDPYPMDPSVWDDSLAKSKLDRDPENMRLVKAAAIERMAQFPGRHKWLFVPSLGAAGELFVRWQGKPGLDLAFVDASHKYEHCIADLRAFWPLIKAGGTLAGHDYKENRSTRHRWGVTRAVKEFSAEIGVPFVVGDGKTYYFHKG